VEFLYFILSLFTGFFGTVILSDMNHFRVTHYRLESHKLKKHIRVIVLADLHDKEYGKGNAKLIQAIDARHPDAIVMAGDMLNVKFTFSFQTILDLVTELSMRYPVYYGMGNHEQRLYYSPGKYQVTYEEMKKRLQDAGAILLDNESVVLNDYGIRITGLSIDKKFYDKKAKYTMNKADVASCAGAANPDEYQLLIAHNPEYFKAYTSWGADLTLAGHLHGGVMRLPVIGGVISPRWQLFPRFSGGIYSEEYKKMVVSCGLGTHTIPVRVFNPGEVVCIDIRPTKKE